MKTPAAEEIRRSYHVYLLRIWQDTDPSLPLNLSWRFSLEDANTQMRRGFRDLDSLLAYLNDLTGPLPPTTDQGE